jgi:hypothetical protein
MTWGFYGRQAEKRQLAEILGRGRWFFVKLTGRRRIGKTTLIQQALLSTERKIFYLQIPDSGPAGVLSAVADAMETFGISRAVSEDIFHFLFATAPPWKLAGNLCLRPGRLLPEAALA